jgi:hypothetical protein
MNTKRPIVDFIAQQLPDFHFVGERRPNLLFRWRLPSGIYRMIAIQRDPPSNGLAIELAVTYNPNWRGEPAAPLGLSTGLANLRLKSRMIEAIQHWFFYEPSVEGLLKTLQEAHTQFDQFSPKFFEEAEGSLMSRRLLQLALAGARSVPAARLLGLGEAKGRLVRMNHPAYLSLRDELREAWTPDIPREDRTWTNRLAYDCLMLRLSESGTLEK